MKARLYEHPVKSRMRRVVRNVLLTWLAFMFIVFALTAGSHGCYVSDSPRHYISGCWPSVGLIGMLYGLPASAILCGAYRILRFAFR